ncbi:MAG: c-type cytochrome [Bacteroidia bacterium]|nr:cytochrome c [Bacteroidia bacterium]MCZ2277897.1 c-type cytochrome [Bacteroidia bacterium]
MAGNIKSILAVLMIALFFVACKSGKNNPGYEFMPDMYRSAAVKTYRVSNFFKDSLSAREPVVGTIPRGINNYFPYPNTNEGYLAAGAELKNPIPLTDSVLEKGKQLFLINCKHCHGEKGDGKGTLRVKGDPFPVPSYFDAVHLALKEGNMFFSITYGKNLMGEHAYLLTQEERWELVHYIQHLQKPYLEEQNKSASSN